MEVLQYIKDMLEVYNDEISKLQEDSDSTEIDNNFRENIYRLRDLLPELLYPLYDIDITYEEAYKIIKEIKTKVQYNSFPIIPWSNTMDIINNNIVECPCYIKFDNHCNYFSNAIDCNELIFRILLSFPLAKIRLYCIDANSNFNKNDFNSKIFNKIIYTKGQLISFFNTLDDEINLRKSNGYNTYLFVYIKSSNKISDFSIELEENINKRINFLNNTGIYFIRNTFIHDSEICQPLKNYNKTISTSNKGFVECNQIINNPNLMKACIDYVSNERDKYLETYYQKDFSSIEVPIGITKSNIVINLYLDLINHVHAFIIGQSGSGKSILLHNIINSIIYKYAPEDLQLYLLDFKLGGVEFNRYKDVKHVKALLVDNSDQQITLEILRELRNSMIKRGRIFRDAGVNNLVEYNKKNPSATMPQILLVVDECHEMFRVGSDVPRTVSNEISEIVTKIAKEGRSQGVHLIMATQTLSGTEISNEILNNISDHYLLKCASVDSERMVERSTDITSKLSTGHIYYHHVDSQITFQGYYVDKENAELQIQKIKDKAKDHASNGEFYFNGSQLFQLNKNVLESSKNQKHPTAYIGKNISIKKNDLSITLKKDFSENILLFGLNEQEQVTRTTMNIFLSLLYHIKCKGIDMHFKVLNCLFNEESIYTKQLEMLESKGLCEIIEGKTDRGCFLKQLAEDVINGISNNTILLILGQERFRELKLDLNIANDKELSSNDAFGFGEFSFSNSSSSSSTNTFRKALEIILDKGPEIGVHVIMQLDKPSNFLFSDYISSKLVYQKFKHLIMLKSDETASSQLGLNDNVRLENLSRDLERLRAYYYAEESDTYTLFTPYMESSEEEIIELLNL